MRRIHQISSVVVALLTLAAAPASAQLSLVPNRMIDFDYDKNGTTPGCPDVADNGVYFSCPTINVTFDMSKGIWKADLQQTIGGVTYSSTIYPSWSKIGYYPAVGSSSIDANGQMHFSWFVGVPDMELLGDGWLQCNGYDGGGFTLVNGQVVPNNELTVEGDLAPGPTQVLTVNGQQVTIHLPNGVLFRRPAEGVYLIKGAFPLLYMALSVKMQGVEAYEEAVYPTSFCWFIPNPQ